MLSVRSRPRYQLRPSESLRFRGLSSCCSRRGLESCKDAHDGRGPLLPPADGTCRRSHPSIRAEMFPAQAMFHEVGEVRVERCERRAARNRDGCEMRIVDGIAQRPR